MNKSGARPAERSVSIPACLPLRKCDMTGKLLLVLRVCFGAELDAVATLARGGAQRHLPPTRGMRQRGFQQRVLGGPWGWGERARDGELLCYNNLLLYFQVQLWTAQKGCTDSACARNRERSRSSLPWRASTANSEDSSHFSAGYLF